MLRLCKKCRKKTPHTVTEIDVSIYKLKCDICKRELLKKRPPKKIVKTTVQYDNVPTLRKDDRVELVNYPLANLNPYPACKNHGALLAYNHYIYRCIECGFAVKWERL